MSTQQMTDDTRVESMRIGPDDPRYLAVVNKRFNKRFSANPDYVRLVSSTEEVVSAVEEAVREGRRLVVTSGGHCLEGFVSDPDVRAIIDVAPMKRVYYDAEMGAVAVEAGATVGETFRTLFEMWGVVIPLGEYPEIGMGGHVVGGAFGFLCRQLGLAADYLYAVEVVTVYEDGRASSVVATRETSDPNRDLWWAHTGGGGGNFGVVTRYWFRSPDASGDDPARLLPRAPESITTFRAEWNWSDIDQSSFLRLLKNHGIWSERNSDADSPNASLWHLLIVHRKQVGKIIIRGLSTAGAAAERQIDDYIAALSEGITAPRGRALATMSWLEFALNPFPDLFATPPGGVCAKVKDALLKKRLTDRQIAVAYDYMTRTDYDVVGGVIGFATYGGRINAVAPDATASAQRESIFDMACNTGWIDPRDAEKNLKWVRAFYRDLFAESGGVPVPGDAYEGGFINHPDTDLAHPSLNTSGVPWYTLYYKENYPRLQRIKARWDPRNVFRHALSIQAVETNIEDNMGAQIPDVLSSGASIWLRVIAWIFKLSGSLFAFVAVFGLIPLVSGWTASADNPGYALSFLLSLAMAGALFTTGVLLARRERAGALLALVLTLYPLAFVLAGQRPLSRYDVIVTVVTVAVIASIWPQLSSRRRSTPAK